MTRILGIFEDFAQEGFHRGLIAPVAVDAGGLDALHAVLEEEAGRPLKLPPGPPSQKTEAPAKLVLDDWITAVVRYPPVAPSPAP